MWGLKPVNNLSLVSLGFNQIYPLVVIIVVQLILLLVFVIVKIIDAKKRKQQKKEYDQKIGKLIKKLDKKKRKLEQITEMNNRRFNYINSIFMAMQDGILVFNNKNDLILINPSGQKYLRVDNRILFTQSDLLNNQFYQCIYREAELSLEKSENSLVPYNADDGRYYDIQTSIIQNKYKKNDNLGVLVVVIDVTEKRHAENMRKEFIENVSHEFRTPMTLISGIAEMFKMWDNLESEDRTRAIDIIEIETNRLKRLISDLMILSKIDGNLGTEVVYIDIEDVIKDIITTLRPFANKKGITVYHEINLEYPIIMGNEHLFFQAITNLVDNAIKYSPGNGWVRIVAFNNKTECTISVSDNGVGIPEEHFERVFERFYRVDKTRSSKTGGSGIGLSIVKDVVDMMNGKINIESQVNEGTKFTITLPILDN